LEEIGYSYCGVDANATDAPDIVCAIDEALPPELLQRGPFDFVLCTEVLEHVADWGAAFANFRHLLAPGGRLVITAPHFFNLHEEPYDFWRPTLHAIDYYARRVGLQPIYRRAAGDAWDVLGVLLPNCLFVASSDSVSKRVVAKAVRVAARWTFQILLRRKLQQWVHVEGPLYLSNVVVLERAEPS
jgi:SAM-dependent methyltransferase